MQSFKKLQSHKYKQNRVTYVSDVLYEEGTQSKEKCILSQQINGQRT